MKLTLEFQFDFPDDVPAKFRSEFPELDAAILRRVGVSKACALAERVRSSSKSEKTQAIYDWVTFSVLNSLKKGLRCNPARFALATALAGTKQDRSFFQKLGRLLNRPRKFEIQGALDMVDNILALGWRRSVGPIPPLQTFTDDALTDLVRILGWKYDMGAVRKKRTRLKLRQTDREIRQVVYKDGRLQFLKTRTRVDTGRA